MGNALIGCLFAAAVMTPAASAGLAVIVYIKSHSESMLTGILAAGVLRLLLVVGGSAIIIQFILPHVLCFLAWLGLFYVVTLIAEVRLAISIVNTQREQRLVAVGSDMQFS